MCDKKCTELVDIINSFGIDLQDVIYYFSQPAWNAMACKWEQGKKGVVIARPLTVANGHWFKLDQVK